MNKKILISGIQPTNSLTLGNYLGAIKKIVDLQDEYQTILFVADLHARTIPLTYHKFKFKELEEYKLEVVKMYVACGIDLKKTKIFFQSEIQEHLELFYFLLTHSTVGELSRMTQYKFLSKKLKEPNGTEAALTGLLIYPVLMSSDILLYDADFVAVGKDQEQHLELTSDLARRINERYNSSIFKVPVKIEGKKYESSDKIMDLQSPSKKMSKTADNYLGVIFLKDSKEVIEEKIMKSKTDSLGCVGLNKEEQPGIYNLLNIFASITSISINEAFDLCKDFSYKDLKIKVVDVLVPYIQKIQDQYKNIDLCKIKEALLKHTTECRSLGRKKLDFLYSSI